MSGNINEEHIIQFLKQREQLLLEELKKVRATISVIQSSGLALNSNPYPKQPSAMIKPSKADLQIRKALKPINEFLERGKLDDKISFALTKLKKAYKEEILDVLIENQPTIDVVKLQNAVGVRLSYLLKNNMIAGEKHGRKFNYSLH